MKLPIQQLSELVKKSKSEPSTEDLMKRPCCGSGCTNCPYSPKHKKGNTKVREELKKEAKIAKDKKSGKWILYTKDGSRILGKHENAQDAYKQEYAIQKSMEKKSETAQPKEDQEVNIISKPNKTPRSGFIHDIKSGKVAKPDNRFNKVIPTEEVVKAAAGRFIPKPVQDAIFKGDKKKLSEFGKLGNKTQQTAKEIKKALEASKMEKHLSHPDTQHFLSILEKDK